MCEGCSLDEGDPRPKRPIGDVRLGLADSPRGAFLREFVSDRFMKRLGKQLR